MRKQNLKWAMAGLALISGVARAQLVDRVAAVVNNVPITLSEVEQRAAPELARVVANEHDAAKRSVLRQQAMKGAVELLISEQLLEAQLKELNLDVTEQDIDTAVDDVKKQNNLDDAQLNQAIAADGYSMKAYREFMKKHLAKLKLINLKVRSKVKISDEDLKAEYARWSKLESEDPEVHARHIVILVGAKATTAETEKARLKAVAIAAEARQPGVDFAALARKKSEGPSAGDGGDLGFFRRGVMLPQFDHAVFTLKDGEVSEPVRTNFGWHVIKVEERRMAQVKGFDEIKEQLRDRLLRAQLDKYTERYIQELRQAAAVEVKI